MHSHPIAKNSAQNDATGIGHETALSVLYKSKSVANRHRAAPILAEREQYLLYLLQRGCSVEVVQRHAFSLLTVIRLLKLDRLRTVKRTEIARAVTKYWTHQHRKGSRLRGINSARYLQRLAMRFLHFHHKLKAMGPGQPFNRKLQGFRGYLQKQQYAPDTIETHVRKVGLFLRWYSKRKKALHRLRLSDVDAFIAEKNSEGWARSGLVSTVQAMKSFFRYGAKQRWCKPGLAESARAPRRVLDATRPKGRDWSEVQRLLRSIDGKDEASIRAKAIVSLLATYALRACELVRLRRADFDWQKRVLVIRRSKNGPAQRCFLSPSVGRAVSKYLRTRPSCSSDQLFVTLHHPYRPIRKLTGVMRWRLAKIGITTGPLGPHSIRHAKATHLVNQGTSLWQIAELLGHRHLDSPFIYAKFNLKLLRPVANFSLRGLM